MFQKIKKPGLLLSTNNSRNLGPLKNKKWKIDMIFSMCFQIFLSLNNSFEAQMYPFPLNYVSSFWNTFMKNYIFGIMNSATNQIWYYWFVKKIISSCFSIIEQEQDYLSDCSSIPQNVRMQIFFHFLTTQQYLFSIWIDFISMFISNANLVHVYKMWFFIFISLLFYDFLIIQH